MRPVHPEDKSVVEILLLGAAVGAFITGAVLALALSPGEIGPEVGVFVGGVAVAVMFVGLALAVHFHRQARFAEARDFWAWKRRGQLR